MTSREKRRASRKHKNTTFAGPHQSGEDRRRPSPQGPGSATGRAVSDVGAAVTRTSTPRHRYSGPKDDKLLGASRTWSPGVGPVKTTALGEGGLESLGRSTSQKNRIRSQGVSPERSVELSGRGREYQETPGPGTTGEHLA